MAAAAAAGAGMGERSEHQRWPDNQNSIVTVDLLHHMVGSNAIQYAYFYPHSVVNDSHAVGFMDRKKDARAEQNYLLLRLLLANHYRRISSDSKSRPATVMTMTLITDPSKQNARVGFLFMQWEQRLNRLAAEGADAKGKGMVDQENQRRAERDMFPFHLWLNSLYSSPTAPDRMKELAHADSKSKNPMAPLDDADKRDWDGLRGQQARMKYMYATGTHIAESLKSYQIPHSAIAAGIQNPRFDDREWILGPEMVFSIETAIAHMMKHRIELLPKENPMDPDEPDCYMDAAHYIQRFKYEGGGTAAQVRSEGAAFEGITPQFEAMIESGRTWFIPQFMAHPRELMTYRFPDVTRDVQCDITGSSYRSYMELHYGALDPSESYANTKQHNIYLNQIQSLMPVSADFDTTMMQLKRQSEQIHRRRTRADVRAGIEDLVSHFKLFWNASNKGGGPLKTWITISNDYRSEPLGFSLIGCLPINDPDLDAFDSFVDRLMIIADVPFGMISAHCTFVLSLLAILDAGRRGQTEDSLRLTIHLEGPPGQGKSRLLKRLKMMCPNATVTESTFSTQKAKMSIGDFRVGIEFHDDVPPEAVGCPPTAKFAQDIPSIRELHESRLAKGANQHVADGVAAALLKASATSSKVITHTATIKDGHRATISVESTQYGTIMRNVNANRWDMDSAIFSRVIHKPMYLDLSQGVGRSNKNKTLDAIQLEIAQTLFSKTMSLSVMLNTMIDCGLLPEIDTTIAEGIMQSLGNALYKMGYSDRSATQPRTREQMMYIARSACIAGAISTVFGDLGINAPNCEEKFDYKHMLLLRPYLYVTRGQTAYACETPNVFINDELVYVLEAIKRMIADTERRSKTQPVPPSPMTITEQSSSRTAHTIATNGTAAASKEAAEIQRNSQSMPDSMKAFTSQFASVCAASKVGAVAAAAAETHSYPNTAFKSIYRTEDGVYTYIQNQFPDAQPLRSGKSQPWDSQYIEWLYHDIGPFMQYDIPREAKVYALTDLLQPITSPDGTSYQPIKFVNQHLVIHNQYLHDLTNDGVYGTLQKLMAVKSGEPAVFRRQVAAMNANGERDWKTAATGIIGGGATGGMSYQTYLSADRSVMDMGGKEADMEDDGDADADADADEGARQMRQAALMEENPRPGAVVSTHKSDTRLSKRRKQQQMVRLDSTIANPNYFDDTDRLLQFRMGHIDAAQYIDAVKAEEKLDIKNLTDLSVARRLAMEEVDDPDDLRFYHSLPHNARTLRHVHSAFQTSKLKTSIILLSMKRRQPCSFEHFAVQMLELVRCWVLRCIAYKTYLAFHSKDGKATFEYHLRAGKCRPEPPDGPLAEGVADEFARLFKDFVGRVSIHVQCCVAFVETMQMHPSAVVIPKAAREFIEYSHRAHEHMYGMLTSYYTQYYVGEQVDTTYTERVQRFRVSPEKAYGIYRDRALAFDAQLNNLQGPAMPPLDVGQKLDALPAITALSLPPKPPAQTPVAPPPLRMAGGGGAVPAAAASASGSKAKINTSLSISIPGAADTKHSVAQKPALRWPTQSAIAPVTTPRASPSPPSPPPPPRPPAQSTEPVRPPPPPPPPPPPENSDLADLHRFLCEDDGDDVPAVPAEGAVSPTAAEAAAILAAKPAEALFKNMKPPAKKKPPAAAAADAAGVIEPGAGSKRKSAEPTSPRKRLKRSKYIDDAADDSDSDGDGGRAKEDAEGDVVSAEHGEKAIDKKTGYAQLEDDSGTEPDEADDGDAGSNALIRRAASTQLAMSDDEEQVNELRDAYDKRLKQLGSTKPLETEEFNGDEDSEGLTPPPPPKRGLRPFEGELPPPSTAPLPPLSPTAAAGAEAMSDDAT